MIITVSAAAGLEAVIKRELFDLGITKDNVPAINGRISFEGDLKTIADCNINLSTAGRVYIKLAEF
ncbi:MAG TPA: RNA methyltransferase, partial [Clostridiales bacterium]|nr:RNA methyltransferase [Clostridiales bacterium]